VTAAEAMSIVEKQGAFRPTFWGEVILKIKGGGVARVEVTQSFTETSATT
jgi:hypothetical protein